MVSICSLIAAVGAEVINFGCERLLEGENPESSSQLVAALTSRALAESSEVTLLGRRSMPHRHSGADLSALPIGNGLEVSLSPWDSAGGGVTIRYISTPGHI